MYLVHLKDLFPGKLFIFLIGNQLFGKIPSPSPLIQRIIIQDFIGGKIHSLRHKPQTVSLLFFLLRFSQVVQQLDDQAVAIAFITQQIVQAAYRGPHIFAVLPIHIGNTVFNIVKAPLYLINEIQHILFLSSSIEALRLFSLFLPGKLLLCTDPSYPGIILPHFLQAAFDVHFIYIEIIARFQDVVLFIHHFFHIAFQMLLQQFPVGLLG